MSDLRDFFQGASNSIASNVSAPVDGIAWLLRKAGVPVPPNPMGGSDWMAEKGLTQQPQNRTAGLLGEFAGMAGPMVAATKAPQLAKGLLALDDKAMDMGRTAIENHMVNSGMIQNVIDKNALQNQFPSVKFDLGQNGSNATLSRVVVPTEQRGQGLGTDFMQALTKAADADGATLALSPSSDFGGNKKRLVDFYKRFGFIPNKGRNIDYTISESMRREPL